MSRSSEGTWALVVGAVALVGGALTFTYGVVISSPLAILLWNAALSVLFGHGVPELPLGRYALPLLCVAAGVVLLLVGWTAVIRAVDVLWRGGAPELEEAFSGDGVFAGPDERSGS